MLLATEEQERIVRHYRTTGRQPPYDCLKHPDGGVGATNALGEVFDAVASSLRARAPGGDDTGCVRRQRVAKTDENR